MTTSSSAWGNLWDSSGKWHAHAICCCKYSKHPHSPTYFPWTCCIIQQQKKHASFIRVFFGVLSWGPVRKKVPIMIVSLLAVYRKNSLLCFHLLIKTTVCFYKMHFSSVWHHCAGKFIRIWIFPAIMKEAKQKFLLLVYSMNPSPIGWFDSCLPLSCIFQIKILHHSSPSDPYITLTQS